MTTPLEIRMQKHKPGQLTWPEPELRSNCDTCRHFDQESVSQRSAVNGKGRCGLVRLHQKVDGKVFDGGKAIACPKYEEIQ